MDTLTSINVFRQVVELGSFVRAAEQLDLSTAMVSKHVMAIEKRLGVRLLNRNSHKLSLTEPGRFYLERCKGILDDLKKTELELESLSSAPPPRHLAYCVLRYLHPKHGVRQRARRVSASLAGCRTRYLFRRTSRGPRGRRLRSRLPPPGR
jgi:DNA-binding transcriptional LysR family regulator